jgi:hypothetical protein
MATLIYSDKCKYCYEIIEFIKTKPVLHTIVKYQHVDDGVPQGVEKVPSLITTGGQIYAGRQKVREFLESLAPNKIERLGFSKMHGTRLDNKPSGKLTPIGQIGRNLGVTITDELKRKIEQPVTERLQNLKR